MWFCGWPNFEMQAVRVNLEQSEEHALKDRSSTNMTTEPLYGLPSTLNECRVYVDNGLATIAMLLQYSMHRYENCIKLHSN